jgi:3-methyladenine DNA glycosylase AlkD
VAGKHNVSTVLAWLQRRGSKRNREGMARYGIVAPRVFGVSVGTLHAYAKTLGTDHALAAALWASGWYEARMLAAFVDEPARVTPAQMDRWARAFDNWAICDTVCFHLFDRTPYAWTKVRAWAPRKDEFVRRAAFALLASLVVHDKTAGDAPYLAGLRLIERGARDERHFVKKGVNWALRCIGKRNASLNRAAIAVARRLAASPEPATRWVGKDALRELTSAGVKRRLARRR